MTKQQHTVLSALNDAEAPLTTHELGEALRRRLPDTDHGYFGRSHGILTRLEKAGLVERHKQPGRVSTWSITRAGADALPSMVT